MKKSYVFKPIITLFTLLASLSLLSMEGREEKSLKKTPEQLLNLFEDIVHRVEDFIADREMSDKLEIPQELRKTTEKLLSQITTPAEAEELDRTKLMELLENKGLLNRLFDFGVNLSDLIPICQWSLALQNTHNISWVIEHGRSPNISWLIEHGLSFEAPLFVGGKLSFQDRPYYPLLYAIDNMPHSWVPLSTTYMLWAFKMDLLHFVTDFFVTVSSIERPLLYEHILKLNPELYYTIARGRDIFQFRRKVIEVGFEKLKARLGQKEMIEILTNFLEANNKVALTRLEELANKQSLTQEDIYQIEGILLFAVGLGASPVVQSILEKFKDFLTTEALQVAFRTAALAGNLDLVTLIAKHVGKDLTSSEEWIETINESLFLASIHGHTPVIDFLIANYGDSLATSLLERALRRTARLGHSDTAGVIQALIDATTSAPAVQPSESLPGLPGQPAGEPALTVRGLPFGSVS